MELVRLAADEDRDAVGVRNLAETLDLVLNAACTANKLVDASRTRTLVGVHAHLGRDIRPGSQCCPTGRQPMDAIRTGTMIGMHGTERT